MAASAAAAGVCDTSTSRLRCRVSSNVATLQALHESHGWVPGRAHIRPSQTGVDAKNDRLQQIRCFYASEVDYILDTVFERPMLFAEDGLMKSVHGAAPMLGLG